MTYWYTFISSFIFYIPFIGSALSRAKEYTADNHGYAVVPDGIQGIVLLSGGKYLYPEVDGQQFVERSKSDRGVFVWFVNAMSSHPILTKRLAALHGTLKLPDTPLAQLGEAELRPVRDEFEALVESYC